MSCSRGCCPTQAAHYKSIVFGGARRAEVNAYTKEFDNDMEAFKEFQRNGVQPDQVTGSYRLLQAEAPRHVVENTAPPLTDAQMESLL